MREEFFSCLAAAAWLIYNSVKDSLRAIARNYQSGWRWNRASRSLPGGERVACVQGETYVLLQASFFAVIQNKSKIWRLLTKRLSGFEQKLASPQGEPFSGDFWVLPQFLSDFWSLAKQIISYPDRVIFWYFCKQAYTVGSLTPE